MKKKKELDLAPVDDEEDTAASALVVTLGTEEEEKETVKQPMETKAQILIRHGLGVPCSFVLHRKT